MNGILVESVEEEEARGTTERLTAFAVSIMALQTCTGTYLSLWILNKPFRKVLTQVGI